ncbi:hypothetical protein EVAR_67059_1 [Eumeta japonica]|uniref:Uncharacterized protein n=1 Tax=Eumeta variegata TaxID=151549 RepID=A0A4C1ZHD0_EUMVA|nr:hypothetical protein EVAR_67059_1 [Eumeta japonica]
MGALKCRCSKKDVVVRSSRGRQRPRPLSDRQGMAVHARPPRAERFHYLDQTLRRALVASATDKITNRSRGMKHHEPSCETLEQSWRGAAAATAIQATTKRRAGGWRVISGPNDGRGQVRTRGSTTAAASARPSKRRVAWRDCCTPALTLDRIAPFLYSSVARRGATQRGRGRAAATSKTAEAMAAWRVNDPRAEVARARSAPPLFITLRDMAYAPRRHRRCRIPSRRQPK